MISLVYVLVAVVAVLFAARVADEVLYLVVQTSAGPTPTDRNFTETWLRGRAPDC